MGGVVVEGRNCWQSGHADRLAFLLDGLHYVEVLRGLLESAQRTILLAGWHLEATLPLKAGGGARLADLIRSAALERGVHVYVLAWDPASTVAVATDGAAPSRVHCDGSVTRKGDAGSAVPLFDYGWAPHKRLHLYYDCSSAAAGACDESKLVVIDDCIAVLGGMEPSPRILDSGRDTLCASAQLEGHPEPTGNHESSPWHRSNVSVLLDGDAARIAGDVFRARWAAATGEKLRAGKARQMSPWPQHVESDLQHVEVAIARTPPIGHRATPASEVAQLQLDAIAVARQVLYIETAHLCSHRIAAALAERLAEPVGPEIVVVTSQAPSPWLAEGPARERCQLALLDLVRADVHGRCRIYEAIALDGNPIAIDACVTVVDDRLLRIGSTDGTNRATTIDGQCDLAVESIDNDSIGRGIVRFRDELLAAHLGISADELAAAVRETHGAAASGSTSASLIAAVERLAGAGGTLTRLDPRTLGPVSGLAPVATDEPEAPRASTELVEARLPHVARESRARAAWVGGLLVLAVGVMAAAWGSIAPLLPAASRAVGMQPAVAVGLLAITAAFTLPPVLVAGGVGIVLGPWAGFGLLLAVCVARACATHTLGRMLGREAVRRVAPRGLNRLSRRLGSGSFPELVGAHWLGSASYSLVNLVSGGSGVPLAIHVRATLAAMAPRLLAGAILGSQLAGVFRSPEPAQLAQAGCVLAGVLGLEGLVRWQLARAR